MLRRDACREWRNRRGEPERALRTHEQHVDLVGQQAELAGHGQQHESKLADLGHAEAHRQCRAHRVFEEVHHHADLGCRKDTMVRKPFTLECSIAQPPARSTVILADTMQSRFLNSCTRPE